jgi:predicted dehydrogenase/threonine dehydrogenase-like Zn-dependent dehydrogenase
MLQIIQDLKTGETYLENVPVPCPGRGQVLIRTTRSLVSLGTERMLVEFGKANLLAKARSQPEKVRQVMDKVKSEGLFPTIDAVKKKLDEPKALGYCNVGRVVEVGAGVSGFAVGDRVASNGKHAEYVSVPGNLCARIPDGVTDEEAAFTVMGSIALQGMRLCNPSFGETIVVTGLGLIGLLTVQLLKANGCRVIGLDIDPYKCALAEKWGVTTVNPAKGQDVSRFVAEHTGGIGADGVIITASAKTDEIVSQAAHMCRKRGRIILVGVVGLQLNRADFYEKELSFQVSCSYGPGRYDENYEQKGQDYPIGYVRWTEQRNFQAVLQAISQGSLKVRELITERVPLSDFEKIYSDMGKSGSIASILTYPEAEQGDGQTVLERSIRVTEREFKGNGKAIGIMGAGNFTKMTVLPNLKKCGADIGSICSANGLNGTHLARKYNIPTSTTNYREMLEDPELGLIMIITRHNLHARMAAECLQAGKDVFVEKPLALNREELDIVREAYQTGNNALAVGFNRRFSPHIQAIKKALGDKPGPINLVATMNAGHIPPDVWVHDMDSGGGRIIGEACHYLDLLAFLAGSPIEAVCMNALGPAPQVNTDNASILIRFANGSNGVINYFANGNKGYSKERVEVFSQGRVAVIDNFRRTEAYGFKGFKGLKTRIDKGHGAQFKLITEQLKNGSEALIPFADIENVTLASFACIESMIKGEWVFVFINQ